MSIGRPSWCWIWIYPPRVFYDWRWPSNLDREWRNRSAYHLSRFLGQHWRNMHLWCKWSPLGHPRVMTRKTVNIRISSLLTISSRACSSTVSMSSGTKSLMCASHSSIIAFFSNSSGSSSIVWSSVISSTSLAVISLSSSRLFLLYLWARTWLLSFKARHKMTTAPIKSVFIYFYFLNFFV